MILTKLNAKVDSFAKMLETQISQVAQQVTTSSQTPGVFPGQTEANPKAHVNAISLGSSRKLEDTVVKDRKVEGESDKFQGEIAMIESEKQLDKTKVPFPLRLAKPCLEAQFKKFVNILKKICINIPFVEALSRMYIPTDFVVLDMDEDYLLEQNVFNTTS